MDTLTTDQACTVRYARKRDAILAAAARTINRAGVKGMTLADVAASVGLITTSVTYYFKRKEDLASACFLDAIARLGALVDQALTESTAEKRVSSFVGLCIDLDLANARERRRRRSPCLATPGRSASRTGRRWAPRIWSCSARRVGFSMRQAWSG